MYRYNKYLMLISFISSVLCFWNKDNFVPKQVIQPPVLSEPLQDKTDAQAFNVSFNDVQYRVEPMYQYEISGLLVSYQHHEGGSLHEKWNDHLNVSDLCLVWGDNANGQLLNKINFWNGQFTCNFETGDNETWRAFNLNQISNNHLLSDDPYIRQQLEDVNIGDQVTIKGYLATYSNNSGFKRSSSTVRTDTGNGACETVYISEVLVLSTMTNNWRRFLPVSVFLLILSFIIYFKAPIRFR